MDTGYNFSLLDFSSLTAPAAQARSVRRHRTFIWLLALAGAVSVALLLIALLAAGRASSAFQDVNLSGSLRYRSLWVYGATQPNTALLPEDPRWPAQVAAMQAILSHLHASYPDAVDAAHPAWKALQNSLSRTGRVDWQTANAMRTAADVLTKRIAAEASAQNAASALLLRLGLAGLLCALATSGFLLSGLRTAEQEMGQALMDYQESRDLFLRSINALQEGYLVQDQDGRVLLCNSSAERLLGVSAADLVGRAAFSPDWDCFGENGDFFPEAEQPGVRAIETALPQESVVLGIERPGEARVWFSVHAAPVFHAGEPHPYAAVLTFADITAEKQVQEELQKEREFKAAMLESLQSGVVACDADGTLVLFNRAAREFHGMPELPLSADQWTRHFDLYQPDGLTPLPTSEIPLFRAFSGETVRDAEMVIAPKNRPARLVQASGQAIFSAEGRHLGAVVAMHDITARRRVEQELSRLAAIVESSEEAILAITLDGTIVSWNAGAERLYGYAPSEVIGRHASVLVPAGEVNPVDTVMPRVLRGESIEAVEITGCRRDGAVLNIALTFSPIRSTEGDIIGLSCISRDITARRQAQNALRESETRLRYLSDAAFEGIAVTQNGVILDANPAFLSLYGYTWDQVIGKPGNEFAVPEARDMVRQKIVSGDERAYEVECLRGDGSTFHAEVRGREVLWNGQPARVTAVRDITERKVMEDALRAGHAAMKESEARLAEAQRIAKVGSWEYDPVKGAIVWSGEMYRLLGRDPGLGVPQFDEAMAYYHPEDAPELKRLVQQAANEGLGYELDLRGQSSFPQDGPLRWYHTTGEVTWDAAGGAARITGTLADITERKTLEEALRRGEEAMRAVLGSAPVILYAADKDGIITLSEGTGLASLGLAPGEAVGRPLGEFSGGDPLMLENTKRAFGGETVSFDTRSGLLRLHVALKPQRDLSGAVCGIIAVCFDITERAQSEERFRVLFEQSSNSHLLFDDNGIIDCNPAAVALMRCTDKADLLGIHPARLSPERQPDGRLSSEKGDEMCALARQNGSHHFEWTRRAADGAEFPVEVILTEVTLSDKRVLLSVWHDLTEQKRAEQQIKDYMVILEFQKSQLEETNKELEALATTDGLTGLKNRRTFGARLAEEHARAVRYHQPLSLLLLDVDHFKQYNDAFGHPAGDAVLQTVAEALGHTARDTDVAARYGGEEFAVILPFTDEAGALTIAERVRTVIADSDWEKRPVTVSVGVSTWSLDTPTPDSLIAHADSALYHSKEAGRNCITHGNPSAPPITRPPRVSRAKRPAAAP